MENKRGKFLSAEAKTQLSSLLHALKVLKEGDFTVRLPITEDGLFSEIAGAFNDIVALDEGLADEITRASKVIGEEGNLAERLSLGEVSGAWNAEINSLNALIDNLAQPTTEVTRVITAVARGDLSEKMTLEIEGRAIKGEFLRMGNTINNMVDQLHSFSAEVTKVARAVGTEDILDGQADVPGVGGTWKDLIEREQAEHALKYSEVKYRRLFEAAQDGILIINADTGQITDVNPFLTDMLGYSREELLGKKLWEIGPYKDIEASRLAFQELQSQGYVRYEHLPLENKNGQQMAVEFVSNVYTVNSQRVIQCNIRNITKRGQMKEELRESESHYKELAESISDVFFGLDTDLRYTYWNKASEKLTGVPARDTLGKHPHEVFPDSEQSGIAEKAYKEALRTKKPQYFTDEYQLVGQHN